MCVHGGVAVAVEPGIPRPLPPSRCGMGSHYGTISGSLPAFSASLKEREKYRSPGKNFTTNPSKRGTGYG